ncbi:MAG: IS1595 family transposase [Chloroflexota bacterium]|nr:IS1595 family transposase [Chloroflexota bacterium]
MPKGVKGAVLNEVRTRVLEASMVYTDEAPAYETLPRRGYQHRRVHHRANVYVDGDVHTNTIEGFWSLLKRGIVGVYHGVSQKHLQSYVDEYTYRYNHRTEPIFHLLLERIPEVSVAD